MLCSILQIALVFGGQPLLPSSNANRLSQAAQKEARLPVDLNRIRAQALLQLCCWSRFARLNPMGVHRFRNPRAGAMSLVSWSSLEQSRYLILFDRLRKRILTEHH